MNAMPAIVLCLLGLVFAVGAMMIVMSYALRHNVAFPTLTGAPRSDNVSPSFLAECDEMRGRWNRRGAIGALIVVAITAIVFGVQQLL
jgi:hypothetical protein